ncbi:protein ELYS-like [Strix uralensis]|uniref:protein ELYS-like n=1 Tax=Strix uralensis TaxID=36305 RepID=UPI003DA4C156
MNLTTKGFADLTKQQVVTGLISWGAQVVTWFCGPSLLPEGVDDDMHLSRPFYNCPLIQSCYTGHRQKLEHLSRYSVKQRLYTVWITLAAA